ncbi:MAG: hypothetical protein GQ474_07850 [Sulfurimonas sp.]|nr:hypothetical protein [Sulfurimonas sp.]
MAVNAFKECLGKAKHENGKRAEGARINVFAKCHAEMHKNKKKKKAKKKEDE